VNSRRTFIAKVSGITLAACSGVVLQALFAETVSSIKPSPLTPVDIPQLLGPDGQLDLFLLMGQSNMKGRGEVPPDQAANPHVFMLQMQNDQWFYARDPLHSAGQTDKLDGSDNAGVGPGLSFAETLLNREPKRFIGLIPCAVGGSSINLWKGPGSSSYDETIRRAKLALAAAPGRTRLRGVLWMQGESDGNVKRYPSYESKLLGMIAHLRDDLEDPQLPFISATVRELSRTGAQLAERFPHCDKINQALLHAATLSPWNRCVDLRDLTASIGDGVHYDTATQAIVGRRLAEAFSALPQPQSAPKIGITRLDGQPWCAPLDLSDSQPLIRQRIPKRSGLLR